MKNALRRIGPVILLLIILGACAGGGWIWYDNNIDRSGWVEKDGIRFYQDFHADPVTGWLTLEEGTYYFAEGGIQEAIIDYEDTVFFEILAEELARRDMDYQPVSRENYDELVSRMDDYIAEFEAHGTENLMLSTDEV